MKMLALVTACILGVIAVNMAERHDQREMEAAAAECRKSLGRPPMLLVRQVGEGYICAVPKIFIPRKNVRSEN